MTYFNVFSSGSSVPGLSPGWGNCVVVLGKTRAQHNKTIYSHDVTPPKGISTCRY